MKGWVGQHLVSDVALVHHRFSIVTCHNIWGRHAHTVHHMHTYRLLHDNNLNGTVPELAALTKLDILYAAPLATVFGQLTMGLSSVPSLKLLGSLTHTATTAICLPAPPIAPRACMVPPPGMPAPEEVPWQRVCGEGVGCGWVWWHHGPRCQPWPTRQREPFWLPFCCF